MAWMIEVKCFVLDARRLKREVQAMEERGKTCCSNEHTG